MPSKDLDKTIARIRNLPQYKNYSEDQLKDKATELLAKKKIRKNKKTSKSDVEWIGLNSDEAKLADEKYKVYIEIHDIETFSDKQDLRNLVQNEVLYEQFLLQIHGKNKKVGKNASLLDERDVNSLAKLSEEIHKAKTRLGLNSKKTETWKDFWAGLIKRIHLYLATHSGQFQIKCPHPGCNQMIMLLRRVKNYKAFKFTMFKGTYLYNLEMMKDIESGKLTQEDVARYWGIEHTDYIQGIYEEIYLKEKAEKERSQEIINRTKEIE